MFALLSFVLAAAPSQLTLDIKPADTILYVDGKKLGDASKPRTVKLKAGPHEIKLTRKGDTHNDEVVLKPGQHITWKFDFGDDGAPKQPTPTAEPEGDKPPESPPATHTF